MHEHKERRCHLTGWWVFVGSAVCFIIAGIRSGDLLTIIGGILFLLGCLIFLYPMACRLERGEEPGEQMMTNTAGDFARSNPGSAEGPGVWREEPVCCECGQGASALPRNGPGATKHGA